MEKIVKKVMVPKYIEVQSDEFKEIVIYKTSDGQEFNSYFDAQQHEDRLTFIAVEKVEIEFQGIGDYCYKAKSQEEVDAIIRHLSRSSEIHKTKDIVVGEWFSINWDIDGGYCDIIILSKFKENVEKLCNFLENKDSENKT